MKIAWRYLFARKSEGSTLPNAINIVSGVSAAGVCVATAALVCVLSVMNGFNRIIEEMFSNFDPELVIRPAEGKVFSLTDSALQQVKKMPEVDLFSPTVEETAMLTYKDHQTAALVKGVSDDFQRLASIDSIIYDGEYCVWDGAFDRCVMGWGLADRVGINAQFVGAVHLYAPKRMKRVNLLRPDESLNRESAYIAGVFAVNQEKYDNQYVLVSLACARRLFDYDEDEATAVELRLHDGCSIRQTEKQIRRMLGSRFEVLNRYEQQADFFRISRIEKLLCTLLLAFILMIASFNIIGSLSMLMIDKKADIIALSNLGASEQQIRRIFLFEGWMISALGALVGLVIGVGICVLQEQFGWLKLGNGYEYAISAYPVAVEIGDILLIAAIVLLLGFLAAWYPTRHLRNIRALGGNES